MTTVLFIRHGEIEKQEEVAQFRSPGFPLSALGEKHVLRLAKNLSEREVDAVYSSPILRCQQTAKIIGKELQVEVQNDERLFEVDSPFAGMEREKFVQILGAGSLYEIPEQMEKGESAEAIVARMRSFLDDVLEKMADKTVVVVSHGDPIMLLWCSLVGRNVFSLREDWPEYVPRGGFYELTFERGEMVGQKLVSV